MADCPSCGTWNPEDKELCWRCQERLPPPVVEKKRKPTVIFGLPLWAWVVLIIIFFAPMLSQCFIAGPPAS